MSSIEKLTNNYQKNGTILVPLKNLNNPLTEDTFKDLKILCEKVDKELIHIGDAGEKNNLLVGRFMTDIKKPVLVKNKYSKKMLAILKSKKIQMFIKNILTTKKKLHIRRVQFNQISKNNFVGYHLDIDSNPDYIAACVIQLGSGFKGGIYRVYQKNNKKKFLDYKPTKGSLIISNCLYPHEVTKVLKGKRGSLVFFVSYNNGKNKRKN